MPERRGAWCGWYLRHGNREALHDLRGVHDIPYAIACEEHQLVTRTSLNNSAVRDSDEGLLSARKQRALFAIRRCRLCRFEPQVSDGSLLHTATKHHRQQHITLPAVLCGAMQECWGWPAYVRTRTFTHRHRHGLASHFHFSVDDLHPRSLNACLLHGILRLVGSRFGGTVPAWGRGK